MNDVSLSRSHGIGEKSAHKRQKNDHLNLPAN
jgi:hypothetical protein